MKRILSIALILLCGYGSLCAHMRDSVYRTDVVGGDTMKWYRGGLSKCVLLQSEIAVSSKFRDKYFPSSMDVTFMRMSFTGSKLWREADLILGYMFLNLLTWEERAYLLDLSQNPRDFNEFRIKLDVNYVDNEVTIPYIWLPKVLDEDMFSSRRIRELVNQLKVKIYIPPLAASPYRYVQNIEVIEHDLNITRDMVGKYLTDPMFDLREYWR